MQPNGRKRFWENGANFGYSGQNSEQVKEKATKFAFCLFQLTFACDKSYNKWETHFCFY